MDNKHKKYDVEDAKMVLQENDLGSYICPTKDMYPHQWLWDSCFIAIGLRHTDPEKAKHELLRIFKSQWKNGMIPHMIFEDRSQPRSFISHFKIDTGKNFWNSRKISEAPDNFATSGITQPPMLAHACLLVAEKLPKKDASAFLRKIYPKLLQYHEWLYRERDPDSNGQIALFHPWESGLDNAPAWMEELSKIKKPFTIKLIELLQLDNLLGFLRRDTELVSSDQRMKTSEALHLISIAHKLKRQSYTSEKILKNPKFVVESLSFNSILIANNRYLTSIAKKLKKDIPDELKRSMKVAEASIELLWDDSCSQYCDRNYLTGKKLQTQGISALLPLYAGVLTKKQASDLVKMLDSSTKFKSKFPIPSAMKSSSYYNEKRYWQGPSWINTNWLIIQGLDHYGFTEEANTIKHKTIKMVEKAGFYEYFSPKTGEGYGSPSFSWTASLYIDLINS